MLKLKTREEFMQKFREETKTPKVCVLGWDMDFETAYQLDRIANILDLRLKL